nr:hypothetical protein [uncultured Actinoplanes sp.]
MTCRELLQLDPRRLGGRGMLVVDAVSRAWESRLTATGKVVWAHLSVEGPAARG